MRRTTVRLYMVLPPQSDTIMIMGFNDYSFRIYNFEFTKKGDASLHHPQETNYYAAYLFTYKPDYVHSSLLYQMDHSYS